MSNPKRVAFVAGTVGALLVSGAAQAALVDRGGGMIYDTTLNITWLADWNYAQTSGFDADGLMNWPTANNWANNLVFGGFSDWRLPTSLNADGSGPCGPGANCSGSEMGHLFYNDLGGKPAQSVLNQAGDTAQEIANVALFSFVDPERYWSSTELASSPGNFWYFGMGGGSQSNEDMSNPLTAVAVRPGDVAASVPEPQTLALALLALGATVVARRRRSR